MSKDYCRILRNRKRRIERRLDPEKTWCDQPEPIMTARNIHYEMADKSRGINCGGIGAIHMMVNRIGLREEIDRRLHLLKVHLPYHESATRPRRKPERVKEGIVRFKGYENKNLTGESVAEIEYQPNKCKQAYRLIIVRKNISVQKGERVLFDEVRHFFYTSPKRRRHRNPHPMNQLPPISFRAIRPFRGTQHGGFEELCVSLFREESDEPFSIIRIEGSGGDGGVEAYTARDPNTPPPARSYSRPVAVRSRPTPKGNTHHATFFLQGARRQRFGCDR